MTPDDSRLKLVLVDDHDVPRAALAKRLRAHPQVLVAGDTADPLEAHDIIAGQRPHVVLIDTVREDEQGPSIISSLASFF